MTAKTTKTSLYTYSYVHHVTGQIFFGGMRAPSAKHVRIAFANVAANGKVTVELL